MAATTEVRQYVGSGPTGTAITNLRYCTADAVNDGSSHTLVRPSAGTNYSYVAWTKLACTTTPAGTINNIKFYTDGAGFGTGITVKGITTSSYTQATGTSGTSGDLSATVYTSGTDLFTYTTGSPLSVTGTISNPSTGAISDYVASQLALTSSAAAGTMTAETYTYRYDET